MNAVIKRSVLKGNVASVPSKSAGHRVLICAALSDKPTNIKMKQSNDDIDATADCLREMGAEIIRTADGFYVTPILKIPNTAYLRCGESGSTLRFLLPIAASILPSACFYGSGRLPYRPIGELQEVMKLNGVIFDKNNLPFTVSGKLRAGIYRISGNVSSQYISGLLMALPLLSGDSQIELTSPLYSEPYVNVTVDMLSKFGVIINRTESGFFITGNQKYKSPGRVETEGDWSGASFYLAAGAICGETTVFGLKLDSRQGDKAIVEILKKFGADISAENDGITVRLAPLKACKIDVSEIPDLFPILSVIGACAEGTTVLYNASALRLKESDRISSTATLINSLGGKAVEYPDRLEVSGTKLNGGIVDSFHDHRIVMSAAIAASICDGETIIIGAEAINKSYPAFFSDYTSIGGKVNLEQGR